MAPFAWPIAVVVLVIVFMLFFYKPIYRFLSRVKDVTRAGITTVAEQQAPQAVLAEKTTVVEEYLARLASPVVLDHEAAIRRDLTERKIGDGSEAVKVLTRELAVTKAALTHEWRDNLIYGSQIELLRTLNAAPVGLGGAAIEPLYAKAAADWSIVYKNYPFQAWLDFLITGGLVHRQEDRFLISVLGRDYLSYLVATGRTGFRAF